MIYPLLQSLCTQRFEHEPKGQGGENSVEEIARQQLEAQRRILAAEHVRHQVDDSGGADQPGHECANPPSHLVLPPCVYRCDLSGMQIPRKTPPRLPDARRRQPMGQHPQYIREWVRRVARFQLHLALIKNQRFRSVTTSHSNPACSSRLPIPAADWPLALTPYIVFIV